MALLAMGEQPSWIGFAGGASGEELIAGLNAVGIQTQSVESRKPTRVNLAILDADGVVTEILEPGGPISPPELDLFCETCERSFSQIKNQAVAIFSGSLPLGAPQDFYAELIRSARQAGCRTFLDTSGAVLQLALEQKPDFVKPNREEAEHLIDEAVTGIPQARNAVADFFSRGARSVALSLGKDGLLWCAGPNQHVYRARPPVVEARLPPEETARWAAACGAANCLAVSPGRIRMADVEEMMKKTTVEKLE
jgi:fructose-1-phosphate kinase PfkB-like protein